MNTRTLKLLSATTAFVALASASFAETPTTSSTTPVINTDGEFYVNSGIVISTTTGAALTISGTGIGADSDATVGVSTTGVLSSASASGTITLGAEEDLSAISGTVTITNSGSIVNTLANGIAINATTAQSDTTNAVLVVNNMGTISGSINFSDAATGNSLTNTGGTITGDINGGSGEETITLNGGTYTGNISLGNGTNLVTVSGTTLNGNYTGGDDSDRLTLVNGSVSGTMAFGNGTADALYVSGTNTFTTKGAITGLESFGVSSTTANFNHSVAGTTTGVTVASGATLNINEAQSGWGVLTNNGTVNITSGTTAATTYATTGVTNLGFSIVSNTNTGNNGKLTLSGGGANLSNTSLTVTMGANAGYIASGTTFTLVDGSGASVNAGTLLASSTGVYRLSTEVVGSNDVVLTVGRVSTSSVVGSNTNNQTIANTLDVLGAASTGSLLTVQSLIGQQSTAAGVASLVESLAPAIDGVGAASVGVTQATGNQVSNRLASLRGKSVATGDALSANHMWVEGYGSKAEQDDNDGKRGYDANGGGVTFGVDTDTLVEGFTTGASFSYGKATVDSNASGNGSTDVDTYVATVYGSRVLDQGIFVNAQAGLGFNQYESERTVSGLGTAKGEFDGLQGTAKVEAGKDYSCDAWTFTPLASAQYTYLNLDSYTETGIGNAGLTVNPDDLHALDLGLGAQVAYTMPLASGGTLKPNVRAKYIYSAGDRELATTSRFVGGGTSFNTTGVEADASSINLGAGLLLTTVAGADFSVNYDADLRSSMTGHAGQLKARWAF